MEKILRTKFEDKLKKLCITFKKFNNFFLKNSYKILFENFIYYFFIKNSKVLKKFSTFKEILKENLIRLEFKISKVLI